MKHALIAALTIAALAAPLAHGDSVSAHGEAASVYDETRGTLRAHVLRLINRDRALDHLPPVELDVAASALADAYCREQIVNHTTGHFTLDGLAPYMRYSFAGGNDGISENAAAWSATYAFSDRALYELVRRSEDAMMAEMAPHDGHRKTILDPYATHVGIGLAWDNSHQRGEFRLVHEFVRRYVDWTRPLPRRAQLTDAVLLAGKPLRGMRIAGITVHHEPFPHPLDVVTANRLDSYALPASRREYLPRLKTTYSRRDDGTLAVNVQQYANGSRGDFRVGDDGAFSFSVPFADGAGIYTVVVWVQKPGNATSPIAASNISIRVDAATPAGLGQTAAGGRR
ncbi:MAG: CAP domain-containing protein [Acidobacteria bacterium]|nr:CAP domain-containing protein [Acidobacteriota bacterium]MBV9477099.1 CAP domain-containing protein [Acidobacteriota bacterium]